MKCRSIYLFAGSDVHLNKEIKVTHLLLYRTVRGRLANEVDHF